MNAQPRTRANGPGRSRQNVKLDIDDLRRAQTTDRCEHHSPFNFVYVDACEIHRGSLARLRPRNGGSMYLHSASTHATTNGQQLKFVTRGNVTRHECAGNDCAKT